MLTVTADNLINRMENEILLSAYPFDTIHYDNTLVDVIGTNQDADIFKRVIASFDALKFYVDLRGARSEFDKMLRYFSNIISDRLSRSRLWYWQTYIFDNSALTTEVEKNAYNAKKEVIVTRLSRLFKNCLEETLRSFLGQEDIEATQSTLERIIGRFNKDLKDILKDELTSNTYNARLIQAVQSGDIKRLQTAIALGADLNAVTPDAKRTPVLAIAAKSGFVEIVKWLSSLEYRISELNVNFEDTFGRTPLLLALASKTLESRRDDLLSIVTILVRDHANIAAKATSWPAVFNDWSGWNALHIACFFGSKGNSNETIVSFLLKNYAPLDSQVSQKGEYNGWTPLHISVKKGDTLVVKKLLEAGANPTIPNANEEIPSQLTINREIKLLLGQYAQNVGRVDLIGRTDGQALFTELSGRLRANPKQDFVNLQQNTLEKQSDWIPIFSLLRQHIALRSLDLHGSVLDDDAFQSLCELLLTREQGGEQNQSQLEVLTINQIQLNLKRARDLARFLMHENKSLKELDVGFNRGITEEGMLAIIAAIKYHPTLQRFKCYGNDLTKRSGVALLDAMTSGRIKRVYIDSNPNLSHSFIQLIENTLPEDVTTTVCNLTNNEWQPSEVQKRVYWENPLEKTEVEIKSMIAEISDNTLKYPDKNESIAHPQLLHAVADVLNTSVGTLRKELANTITERNLTDFLNDQAALRSGNLTDNARVTDIVMKTLNRFIVIINSNGEINNLDPAKKCEGEPLFIFYNVEQKTYKALYQQGLASDVFKRIKPYNKINTQTLIHVCAYYGAVAALNWFFNNKPENVNVNIQDQDGSTLLHSAVSGGNSLRVIDFIVKHSGVNLFVKDHLRRTALHLAASMPNYEYVAGYLWGAMNKVQDEPDQDGFTVAHHAALAGNEYLLRNLVMKFPEILDQKTKDGRTLLMLAAQGNKLKIVKFLCNVGADLKSQDNEMNTVLHYLISSALENQYEDLTYDVVVELLEKGLSTEIQNNNNQTPYDLLSDKNRNAKFAKLLTRLRNPEHSQRRINAHTYEDSAEQRSRRIQALQERDRNFHENFDRLHQAGFLYFGNFKEKYDRYKDLFDPIYRNKKEDLKVYNDQEFLEDERWANTQITSLNQFNSEISAKIARLENQLAILQGRPIRILGEENSVKRFSALTPTEKSQYFLDEALIKEIELIQNDPQAMSVKTQELWQKKQLLEISKGLNTAKIAIAKEVKKRLSEIIYVGSWLTELNQQVVAMPNEKNEEQDSVETITAVAGLADRGEIAKSPKDEEVVSSKVEQDSDVPPLPPRDENESKTETRVAPPLPNRRIWQKPPAPEISKEEQKEIIDASQRMPEGVPALPMDESNVANQDSRSALLKAIQTRRNHLTTTKEIRVVGVINDQFEVLRPFILDDTDIIRLKDEMAQLLFSESFLLKDISALCLDSTYKTRLITILSKHFSFKDKDEMKQQNFIDAIYEIMLKIKQQEATVKKCIEERQKKWAQGTKKEDSGLASAMSDSLTKIRAAHERDPDDTRDVADDTAAWVDNPDGSTPLTTQQEQRSDQDIFSIFMRNIIAEIETLNGVDLVSSAGVFNLN